MEATMQFLELRFEPAGAILLALSVCANAAAPAKDADKVPITTSSEEARQLYLKGRDLVEKLRATDARRFYVEAMTKDPGFALAQLGLAASAGTAKEFFDAEKAATAMAPKVSEGERLTILGFDAGVKGEFASQKDLYAKLIAAFPNDERAQNLMAGALFGQQDYAGAIEHYKKAVAINPSFSQPYNQMGYAYRFLGDYAEAEQAFKKYIELIPDDPNPYDSYAELLMKTGRYDESIKSYEKALSVDKSFVASFIGIANNQMFAGRGEEARKTLARLETSARHNGERRQAHLWTAMSYVHEGKTEQALAEIQTMRALAETDHDFAAVSGDDNQAGEILLETGDLDKAAARFRETVEVIERADVPAEVKDAAKRNALWDEARVLIARGDLAAAAAKAEEYTRRVAAKQNPFEMRQDHELKGRLALARKNHKAAVAELTQANQQDPRVLYLLALAQQGSGDKAAARATAARAADFNGLSLNYGYIRSKAKELLTRT
jgi:tetratricopeptide (TPR) repeat protein